MKDVLLWLLGVVTIAGAILALILVFSVPLILSFKLLTMLWTALF